MELSSIQQIKTLIDDNGQPLFGYLTSIPEQLDIDNFRYFSTMDKERGALAKYFHYKQFQFISLFTPDFVIGFAIADIRYVGNSFCYLYDIHRDELIEKSWLRPLGIGYSMTPSPWQGTAQFNRGELCINIEEGVWQVAVTCQQFSMDVTLSPPSHDSAPIMVSSPTGYSGWTYTQKHNALKVSGKLVVKGEPVSLDDALGGYDFSAGYMRRETSWRWASISANLKDTQIGLNLAAGVNETGVNENALWIDGERVLMPAVMFDFDRHNPDSAWRIYDSSGQIDLTFIPQNVRKERLNLWLLKSNFRQFIGRFKGTILLSDGRLIELDDVVGLTEDHFAKW
ncbi:hypothetical protein JCM19240_845 [Vibrio maritimus]|uniref:DUF2804 domain-containing protein n=1 Tax=Vibrio maritimus TaxID=990268 RepID=A0A090TS86_9VIBR|nr:hypothetical protein JCM19240_845 [Vibrio maritimus]